MSVDLSRYCLAQWYGKGEGRQCNYCKKESSKTAGIDYGKLLESISKNFSLTHNFFMLSNNFPTLDYLLKRLKL